MSHDTLTELILIEYEYNSNELATQINLATELINRNLPLPPTLKLTLSL